MKTLKFKEKLAKMILKGEKTNTWRLFDDKNLSEGDEISLVVSETKKEFGKAKLIKVIEKKFDNLEEKDLQGHEKFSSKDEMYETYSGYYKTKVGPKTKLKIIFFNLI
ncbi:MAG: ASCH domain-containing protein [Candidatus Pacearchaeota archaeon]